MTYCTIIPEGHGAPYRFYADRDTALRAARRRAARHGEQVQVAWCAHGRIPKVWLAYVTPGAAVEKTEYWTSE